MEIILTIAVASAVIFFGALISIGNEQQRKSIDYLREQIELWATQDLKIKREHLVRDVRVDEPISWLNKIATKICGHHLDLQVIEIFEEPQAIVCTSGNGNTKIVFCPHSPTELRKTNRKKKNRLSEYSEKNILKSALKHGESYKISVLNGGVIFDLELKFVWKAITNRNAEQIDSIWMYIIYVQG